MALLSLMVSNTVNGGIWTTVKKSMESYGLPLGLVLLGYGQFALASGDPLWLAFGRLILHFLAALMVGRLGLRLGMNRTAALLAGLFFAASPLAAYSLAAGAPVVSQLWTCLMLGFLLWWPHALQPSLKRLGVLVGLVLVGTVGVALLGGMAGSSEFSILAVFRDFLAYGAWFVLSVPYIGGALATRWIILVLGSVVWGFWVLMSVHRYLLDNPLPRNLLAMTGAAVVPLLGRTSSPAFLLFPMAMFSLFIMTFLRPSKLVDSPRILLMAAFFLSLLAQTSGAWLRI